MFSTLQSILNNIKLQKDTYLLPSNVKEGVSLLGVTGTYEGKGEVKLFETEEAMNNDPAPREGDLAVVYREEITPVQETSEFSMCVFYPTITLSEAIEDWIWAQFRPLENPSGGYLDCYAELGPESFRFQVYSESSSIAVQYTSQDGLTYTRTDGGSETIDIGATVKFDNRYETWNPVFGNFIKIAGNYFSGLYEYKQHNDTSKLQLYTLEYDNNTVSGDISVANLKKVWDLVTDTYSVYSLNMFVQDNDTILVPLFNDNGASYWSNDRKILIDTDGSVKAGYYYTSTAPTTIGKLLTITLSTDTITETTLSVIGESSGAYKIVRYNCDLTNYKAALSVRFVDDVIQVGHDYIAQLVNTDFSASTISINSDSSGYPLTYSYIYAVTQLTLSNSSQLLPDVSAYGKNGVVTGDSSVYNNITTQNFLSNWFGMNYSSPNNGTFVSLTSERAHCQSFVAVRNVSADTRDWDGIMVNQKSIGSSTSTVASTFPYANDYSSATFSFGNKEIIYNGITYHLYIKGEVTKYSGNSSYYSSVNSVIYYMLNCNTGEIVASGKYTTPFAPVNCNSSSASNYVGITYSPMFGFDFTTNTLYMLFTTYSTWTYNSAPVANYGIFKLKDTTGSISYHRFNINVSSTSNKWGSMRYTGVYFDFKNRKWVADAYYYDNSASYHTQVQGINLDGSSQVIYNTPVPTTTPLITETIVYCDSFVAITYSPTSGTVKHGILNAQTGNVVIDTGSTSGAYWLKLFSIGENYIFYNKSNSYIYRYDNVNDIFVQYNNLNTVRDAARFRLNNTDYLATQQSSVNTGFYNVYNVENNGALTEIFVPAFNMLSRMNVINGDIMSSQTYYSYNVSSGESTSTITNFEFITFDPINSFPCSENVYIVVGENGNTTKQDEVFVNQSIPLITQTFTTAEYNNALALSNELLGIEEEV